MVLCELGKLYHDNKQKAKKGEPVDMELCVLKNRNGYLDNAYFAFTHRHNIFREKEKSDDALDWNLNAEPSQQDIMDLLKG